MSCNLLIGFELWSTSGSRADCVAELAVLEAFAIQTVPVVPNKVVNLRDSSFVHPQHVTDIAARSVREMEGRQNIADPFFGEPTRFPFGS